MSDVEKTAVLDDCNTVTFSEDVYKNDANNKMNNLCCTRTIRKFKSIIGHLSLLIALMLYTAIGGLIFRELELPTELARLARLRATVQMQRHHLVGALVNNTDASNFEKLVRFKLKHYEYAVQEAAQSGIIIHTVDDSEDRKNPENTNIVTNEKWSFLQAVFFASTVLTTIGYGNLVPLTTWGRMFCIIFALIGIPLTLTIIADWGRLFAELISVIESKMRPKLPQIFSSCMPSNLTGRRSLGALAAVAFLFLYLSCGAGMFMLWEEDWTFFEGFYFCFVTMTTIGFGDVVPKRPKYMLLCTLYILVGLALTSTIIELVRRQYASSWKKLRALRGTLTDTLKKLGDQCGDDMSAFNSDLRKILTVVSMPRLKRGSSISQENHKKEWEEAIEAVLKDIKHSATQTSHKKPIIQIIIYESSV